MKTITLEVPDDCNVITASFISTELFSSWILPSAFQPDDGMTVTVAGKGAKHHLDITRTGDKQWAKAAD